MLAAAFVVTVAMIGLVSSHDAAPKPLALPAVPAPDATSGSCRRLIDALPETVKSNGADLPRRRLASPAPAATVAWDAKNPIVLRCGVGKPRQLKPTSEVRQINGVQWLPVGATGTRTWYVVDRPVYVALTVTGDVGTGPLQDVSNAVARALPAR